MIKDTLHRIWSMVVKELLQLSRDKVLMVLRNISGSASSGLRKEDAEDTLTGLTTRDVFMNHFDSVIADAKLRERGVAVFCIDIDRFSRINSTLGRAGGDAVRKVQDGLVADGFLMPISTTPEGQMDGIFGDEISRRNAH